MPSSQSVCSRATPPPSDAEGGWRETRLANASDVLAFVERLLADLAAQNWSEKDRFAIRLSLEEAIVNAHKHGHQADATKQICVRERMGADAFLAQVEDQGPGFNPHEIPNPTEAEYLNRPCGRGVFLMRHYMTWVRFNERGNCVTLCKYRTVPS